MASRRLRNDTQASPVDWRAADYCLPASFEQSPKHWLQNILITVIQWRSPCR